MICIVDDCCNTDCHQSKKELLQCKRYFKKNYRKRKLDNCKIYILKSRVKVDDNNNIIDVQILEEENKNG